MKANIGDLIWQAIGLAGLIAVSALHIASFR
jgi:hypothetical protein